MDLMSIRSPWPVLEFHGSEPTCHCPREPRADRYRAHGDGTGDLAQDASDLLQSQQRNLGSLLHLVQTLAKIGGTLPPRLWVVTRNAQQLSPAATVNVAQTPLWGMGRTISLEHSQVWGGMIDVDGQVHRTSTMSAVEP